MRFLRSRFLQAVLVLVLAFVILRFGIRPPAPRSVLSLYMFIISLAVLVFVSSDRDSWRDFITPIWTTLVRPERRPLRMELRAVHPAPPASIQFRGKEFNISGAENPLRKDAAGLKEHAAKGGEIYIRNCMYCHGDNLDGKGHFAPGFNPPPANFQDPGTIAMLQEAYLFWRIAKGGPGLPKESTPWNSVMPPWEDRLTEEQIWQVIIYLYEATGQQPRRWEASEHGGH